MSNALADVRSLFEHALDLPSAAERRAYLDDACADQPELRSKVEALLKAHADAGSFLGSSPVAEVAQVERTIDQQPAQPGTLIGPYKLLEQIGEGGMGIVYMAQQVEPVKRKVALKVIKPGMDSKQVVARFEAERQALALMDHPHIARVLDAGTTDSGRPYFVMDLVRGIPITEYCDKQRLNTRDRLKLFLDVCHAVQHAHLKGIIHRDLKPSNVLVTLHDGVPVAKVIDFGVAKALNQELTEKTLFTQFSQMVGTPLYMSPEQAELSGLDIDTRSDVYSLGVLLYELLTGTTPFDKDRLKNAGFDELRRIIREDEPETVSARIARTRRVGSAHLTPLPLGEGGRRPGEGLHVASSLALPTSPSPRMSEIDWIVMKAIEKDRNRRYESASAFAADIQRYLSDEPVLACPPTTMYRFQKFARKHKPALVTAAAIAICLVLGTTVSAWQAVRATTAEAQANANATQAQASSQEAKTKAQEATTQRDEAQRQRDEAQRQRDEVKALNDKLAAKDQQLQRNLYASNMNLAKNAWDEVAVPRVLSLLELHRPKPGEADLRGFEWHYLQRLCHAEILTLEGPTGSSPADRSVAFSPDGKRLASANRGGGVKVWDAQTGQELLSIRDGGACVAFSPDGKRLATGGGTWEGNKNVAGKVKVWDSQTGQELLHIKALTSDVYCVSFSPDGKRLASGSGVYARDEPDDVLKVWDAQTGQELLSPKGHTRMVLSVAFSPDGKRLASADHGGTVKVWDSQTGQEQLSLKGGGHIVAFSPDGKRLASDGYVSTGEAGSVVKVRDAETGKELLVFKGHAGQQINSVAFSSDGKRLASAGADRTVKISNSETGAELITFTGHPSMAKSVAFSPDGTRLASAGGGTVKVWDATSSPGTRTFSGLAGTVTSTAFSPDGTRFAAGISNWDDSKQAYAGVALKILEAQTGKELLSIKGLTDVVASVAFSPDGKRLASGSGDRNNRDKPGAVKVWDAQTGQELLSLQGHTHGVTSVVYSPDGKHLASGDSARNPATGTVKVWDAQTGRELFTFKDANGMAFSPDGTRLATGIGDRGSQLPGAVKVWDVQTGQEILSLQSGGGSVAFSPDGKRLATFRNFGGYGGNIGEVLVRDAQTGQELLSLKGHTAGVRSVVYSPDGKRLASSAGNAAGSYGGEVKVWDAETGQELLTLKQSSFPLSQRVAFSPSGHWLVSNAGGTLKIYDATPLPEKP